jgi:hypothetical protein
MKHGIVSLLAVFVPQAALAIEGDIVSRSASVERSGTNYVITCESKQVDLSESHVYRAKWLVVTPDVHIAAEGSVGPNVDRLKQQGPNWTYTVTLKRGVLVQKATHTLTAEEGFILDRGYACQFGLRNETNGTLQRGSEGFLHLGLFGL